MEGRTRIDRRQLLTFGLLSRRGKAASAEGSKQAAQGADAIAPPAPLDFTVLFGPYVPLTWRSLVVAAGFTGAFLTAARQLSTLALLVIMLVAAIVISCTSGRRQVTMPSTNAGMVRLPTEVLHRLRGAASGLVVGGFVGLAACLFWLHAYVSAFGFALPLQIATSCGVALGSLFPRLFGLPEALVCVVLELFL